MKTVDAVQWRGDNRQEVRDFLSGWLSEEMGPSFVRDEYPDDKYNTCQFYYGDDIDVDSGQWIVFDGDVLKLYSDPGFRRVYVSVEP